MPVPEVPDGGVTGSLPGDGPAGDGALAERARGGDGGAFQELFRRHAPGIRRYHRDLLGDETAADEATQETFVRAHGALGLRDAALRVLPWLFGIARNVAREHRRGRARLVPVAEPVAEAVPDRGFDPEALLLGREADAMLARALAAIPDDRRAALVLRADHGLGYDEIATVLGWSAVRVKNEIHRARVQLRAGLSEYVSAKESGHGA